jgi:hypothetical protein
MPTSTISNSTSRGRSAVTIRCGDRLRPHVGELVAPVGRPSVRRYDNESIFPNSEILKGQIASPSVGLFVSVFSLTLFFRLQ